MSCKKETGIDTPASNSAPNKNNNASLDRPVNIKLFSNGSMQLTGCKVVKNALDTIEKIFEELKKVKAIVNPTTMKVEEKPFCKGGTLFREQRYYPGYSPMLGNNWKVNVEGHPNFGKTPPTMTNELVLVCKDQSVERRFYFPLESDFQDFKRLAPQGKFDNTLYNYQNNSASFPEEDFYSTLKLVGTSGQNVTDLEDNGIKKYWYHYNPVPLDSLGAREYLGVSSREHLEWPKDRSMTK